MGSLLAEPEPRLSRGLVEESIDFFVVAVSRMSDAREIPSAALSFVNSCNMIHSLSPRSFCGQHTSGNIFVNHV